MLRINTKNHPCFNNEVAHLYGRVHLPIAPDCNIKCNFCNRKYDCVNENRPGVTSVVLLPEQSIRYLESVKLGRPNISVVGIAGPGEAFLKPEATLRTLRLVRERFPNMILCVATNGLNILPYIDELVKLEVSHITITVNAVDPEVGARIYSWVRYEKKVYRKIEAATLLKDRQIEAIKKLKERDITVKVNTIIVPGINDSHIAEIAEKISQSGADVLNCIPLCPSEGTTFEDIKEPSAETVERIRLQAEEYLPQMRHCKRCRADAAGLLTEGSTEELVACLKESSQLPSGVQKEKLCIAVATKEGALINQHLGEAVELFIYKKAENGYNFLEKRKTPLPGGGVNRWLELANILSDCSAVLVSGVGHTPKEIMSLKGIDIVEVEGIVEEVLGAISQGIEMDALQKRWAKGCGLGCSGGSRGCG